MEMQEYNERFDRIEEGIKRIELAITGDEKFGSFGIVKRLSIVEKVAYSTTTIGTLAGILGVLIKLGII